MKTKYHTDGTITYWSYTDQAWRDRVRAVPDKELAAMPALERARVLQHLEQERILVRPI